MTDAPKKSAFRRIVLPLLEKVLVPIAAAGIGALGVYYAEIAKLAKDAGREAAGEEIKRADDARAFVFANMPAVAPIAPEATSTQADDLTLQRREATLRKMLVLWNERRALDAAVAVVGGQVQDQDQTQDPPQPPEDYLRRAVRDAEMVQAQVQMQRGD